MDDIRRPYRGERRDYALPQHRQPARHRDAEHAGPAAPRTPDHISRHEVPAPHQTLHHPTPHQFDSPASQHMAHHPAAHHSGHPAPAIPKRRRLPRLGLNKPVIIATVLAGAAIFGGYLLLKPDKHQVLTPASLAKNASFSFYYPSPLPAGYSYVNDINAFQDGQAYYMLGNGNKHIVVHEQPAGGSRFDTGSLSNPVTYQAIGGKAALGSVAGQPAGLVLTNTTLIKINSTGDVPPADVAAVINNLRLINR